MLKKSILSAAFLSCLLAAPASATSLETIIRQLKAQGYTEIEVYRTWLGRILIEAENDTHEREIILDRRSFEILRDYAEPLNPDDDDDDDKGGLFHHD